MTAKSKPVFTAEIVEQDKVLAFLGGLRLGLCCGEDILNAEAVSDVDDALASAHAVKRRLTSPNTHP
jgi:hypothetical protein